MSELNIIRVERRATRKGDPMWRCSGPGGETVNIFDSHSGALERAGYQDVLNMEMGDVLNCKTYPIQVTTFANGQWLNVEFIAPRLEGAFFDPDLKFQRNARKESVIEQTRMLLQLDDNDVVVFDFETTGVTEEDEIISGAVLTLKDGTNRLPENNIYVRPSSLHQVDQATHVHGLTSEFMADKPEYSEVYPHLRDALHGKIWIAYNVAFDHRMLDLSCSRYNLEPIVPIATVDAMELYGKYALDWITKVSAWDRVKLTEAVEAMGIPVKDAHDAYGDVNMTRLLLLAMAEIEF